jgi:hypothetical protein
MVREHRVVTTERPLKATRLGESEFVNRNVTAGWSQSEGGSYVLEKR